MNDRLNYLASPFTHNSAVIMDARHRAVNRVAAQLLLSGQLVYSPITHNYPLSLLEDFPRTWEYWREVDFPFLHMSRRLYVLSLNGWETSIGVQAEIQEAEVFNISIEFLVPSSFGITHDGVMPVWGSQ